MSIQALRDYFKFNASSVILPREIAMAAIAEADQLRAALEQVEWVCGWCSENCPSVCPWCEADGWSGDPHHEPNCVRQAALDPRTVR